jgi:hypothetical protein
VYGCDFLEKIVRFDKTHNFSNNNFEDRSNALIRVVRGPIKLKFYWHVHDIRFYNLNKWIFDLE